MEEISINEFMNEAKKLAEHWKIITGVLNKRYDHAFFEPQADEYFKPIFSSELCNSIRLSCAIQILSTYYTVLPNEETSSREATFRTAG